MDRNYDRTLEAVDLHAALYDGAIIRFRELDPMAALTDFARAFLEQALAPHPPIEIHRHLAQGALAERLSAVQRAFSNNAEAKRLWHEVLAGAGLEPAAHRLTSERSGL